ncbi:sigma 54-interacting transcriptional regulator [bacterium]|nr:sigma 54-interacting transcriptional regulator [bacterium]
MNQISRVLNASGDLMRNLNMILIMLKDYLPVRNPCLLINDHVVNHYFIDLAPEISEDEKNLWNLKNAEDQRASSLRYFQGMILYPGEPDELKLPCAEELQRTYVVKIIQPLIFQRQGLPMGILSIMVMSAEHQDAIFKIIRSVADMIAMAMIARGFPVSKIYDSEQEVHGPPRIIDDIIGCSESMKKLAETVHKISSSKASVMIYGESGTGKELLARAIHNSGFHRKAPFVGVNCAALTDSLLESELFGHEKGAFTGAMFARKGRFELADGGTLFLDEIGDTTLNFQTKILRVLQEGEFERLGGSQTIFVDVRIVCATNLNLEKAVADHRFREDLYYRLNVIKLEVPPLRERRADIPLLVNYFLEKLNQQDQKTVAIRPADMTLLQGLNWPGNVRELENAVHSAFLMEQDNFLNFRGLSGDSARMRARISASPGTPPAERRPVGSFSQSSLEEEEMLAIDEALAAAGGVQVKAAENLGISVRQLRYRIKKYNIAVRKLPLFSR